MFRFRTKYCLRSKNCLVKKKMGGGSEFWSMLENRDKNQVWTKDVVPDDSEHENSGNAAEQFQTLAEVSQELHGKKIAIDLSIWIFEGSAGAPVAKPYLRTLFFRCASLMSTKFGACLPVFVSDPRTLLTDLSLKNATRASRFRAIPPPQPGIGSDGAECAPVCRSRGTGGRGRVEDPSDHLPRPRNWDFVRRCRECTALLRLLGIPAIEARGVICFDPFRNRPRCVHCRQRLPIILPCARQGSLRFSDQPL